MRQTTRETGRETGVLLRFRVHVASTLLTELDGAQHQMAAILAGTDLLVDLIEVSLDRGQCVIDAAFADDDGREGGAQIADVRSVLHRADDVYVMLLQRREDMAELASRSAGLAVFARSGFVFFTVPAMTRSVMFATASLPMVVGVAFCVVFTTTSLCMVVSMLPVTSGVCNVGDVLPLAVVVTAMDGVERSSTEMGSAQSPVRFCGKGYGNRHGPIVMIFSKSERNGTGFLWHYLFI